MEQINRNTQESFDNLNALTKVGAPIPGESLTNSPDNPMPWEGPSKHSELAPAIDQIITELCTPEIYHPVVDSMRAGFPVAEMAEQVVFDGFSKGMWNPDLMLLLVEPTMYILIALADMADVEPRIDMEDDIDDDETQLSNIGKAIEVAKEKVNPKQIPKDISNKVKELLADVDKENKSLLAADQAPDETESISTNSLLSREEV